MTACLCPMCTPNPAPTYTTEFRLACFWRSMASAELPAIMRAAGLEARRAIIRAFGKRWGEGAQTVLERLVESEWEKREGNG